LIAVAAALCSPAWGQGTRVNIPRPTLTPSTAPSLPAASTAPSLAQAPSGAALGTPVFDPYAIAPATTPPAYTAPTFTAPTFTAPTFTPPPAYTPPAYTAPQYNLPPATSPYGAAPAFGQPVYGQPPLYAPPVQPGYGQPLPTTPGGNWSDEIGRTDPYQYGEPLRLFQNIRLRHTWISRLGDDDGLGINDSEIATTAAFPRFLWTTQPLYVSPGFILSLWDGPTSPPADLPPRAYSAYVDFDYTTNPQYRLGGDVHVRLGVYSDFDAFDTHSFRVSGRGLGTFRATPEVQLKFGVEYINRNDLKLLPAGGVLWTPNPQVRFDIYFPKPKLAIYVTTLGNTELWAYLAGEYGGGAWTIDRATGGNDRIDINDIRAIVGTEWMTGRSWKGFFEAGYVFNRDVVYVADPGDSFSPPDSFMLRGGLAY
jgi:hypothetical protein